MKSPHQNGYFPRISSDARILGLGLILLALAASWPVLLNSWVQDELPIIFANPLVHSLGNLGRLLSSSYWPEPFPPDLYRPLALTWFAVQWAIGGGAPVVFKVVNVGLYVIATLAVWRLASRLLPSTAAWVVAALFAVHPVHVEAVAVAVNQGELIVAIIVTLAATAWIDRRRAGLPTGGRWGAGLTTALFCGVLVKEHAVVLPAILIALEYTVLKDGTAWREKLRQHRQLIFSFALVLVMALFARDLALGGNTKGSFTAEALEGLNVGGRALTMLSVVPEWARLLVWPAHLQADYSLQEIPSATSFGGLQLLGLLILAAALVTMFKTRNKLATVSLGIAWLAISLGPVHNVLVTTGIVLAERTLFLGSIGFLICIVSLASIAHQYYELRSKRLTHFVSIGATGALLILGISRSSSRATVWHDRVSLWTQTLIDAPLSYRAHHAMADLLFEADIKGSAEIHYKRAVELHPNGWQLYSKLADKYRLAGTCSPAIDLYLISLSINPLYRGGRGSLIACYMHVGDYEAAGAAARDGVELDEEGSIFERYEFLADSALKSNAAPGSIKLPLPPDVVSLRP